MLKLLKIYLNLKKNNLKFFFQFSTDALYDSKINVNNKETNFPKTNNIYSKHKNLVEKICLKNKSLIFRTNFLANIKIISQIGFIKRLHQE